MNSGRGSEAQRVERAGSCELAESPAKEMSGHAGTFTGHFRDITRSKRSTWGDLVIQRDSAYRVRPFRKKATPISRLAL